MSAKLRDFDWLLEKISEFRENMIKKNEMDAVTVVSGYEGSGKSTVSIAIAAAIDPNFSVKDNVCFLARDYINKQLAVLVKLLREKYEPEIAEQILQKYNIPEEAKNASLDRGSVLIYDEAGTQMNSRESIGKMNVLQQKLFISNRFLGLIHFLNVPKPRSLDVYVREERLRWFFYVYYLEDLRAGPGVLERQMAVYAKSRINYVMLDPKWYKYFTSYTTLIRLAPPTAIVKIPDFKDYPEIYKKLEEYKKAKIQFNLDLFRDTMKIIEELEKDDADATFITVQQAAALFNLSQRCIRDAIKNEEIDAEKIGGKWFIEPKSLREFIISSHLKEFLGGGYA